MDEWMDGDDNDDDDNNNNSNNHQLWTMWKISCKT